MNENDISGEIIGAAIEVHRHLGPGLLESVYRDSLGHELGLRGLVFEKEVALPVRYKGVEISSGYRIDLMVQQRVIAELKAVETLLPVFTAQLLSYLRLSGLKLGLLINFNVMQLKDGVRRVVNNF